MAVTRRRKTAGASAQQPLEPAEEVVTAPSQGETTPEEPAAEDAGGEAAAPPPGGFADVRPAAMPRPWGGIVNKVFDIDVDATYRILEHDLTLGDGATDYGTVLQALDTATANAFLAVRLVRKAKLIDIEYSMDCEAKLEILRSSARKNLAEEKANDKKEGKAAKAPTIQEIEDAVIAGWPDEVRSLKRRKEEMHGTLRAIEGLEKAWWERCAALRQMIGRFQQGRA